jgi:hypothetical protein
MSMVAVLGLCIAMAGMASFGVGAHVFVIGFALCVAFLVQAVRALQKQIDELKAQVADETAEQ